MAYAALACRGLIGMVFAISMFAKVRKPSAYREFASWLAVLPVPLARNPALPVIFVAGESTIVVLVAIPDLAIAGLALAAGCLVLMAAGTVVVISRNAELSCWCFGPSRSPIGSRHLVRDGILLVIAVTGAVTSVMRTGQGGENTTAIVLSLLGAIVGTTFLVFTDDLTALFGENPAVRATDPQE